MLNAVRYMHGQRIILPSRADEVHVLDFSLLQERALDLLVAHVVGIYSSMFIYRAFLHRLNRFPGPFAARLSTFYATYLSARNFRLIDETERLHKEHGDYVRLGMRHMN